MVTINPADCPPDLVYMGIVNGRREVMCRFPHRELPWETFANVHADDSVSDLVPLVEARPITRDEQGEMWARIRDELRGEYPSATDYDHRKLDLAASASADAVVEYLNDRGGLGIDTREPLERALRERDSFRCDLDWARGKCDELRSLIEGQKANVTQAQRERDTARFERDAAFESYKRMKRERDGAISARDSVLVRVRQAEDERDAAVARAEKAEARTAPVDPVVLVVGESDVTTCQVRRRPESSPYGDAGSWEAADQTWLYSEGVTVETLDEEIEVNLRGVVQALAVRRAIEAEQAVDPVEELTDNLADILYGHEMVTDQMRGVLERVVRAGMLLPEQEADQ